MASGDRRRSGQHMAEFVVLMGITVTAALTMQYLVQRAVRGGVQRVSDEALGPPPPANTPDAIPITKNEMSIAEKIDQPWRLSCTMVPKV